MIEYYKCGTHILKYYKSNDFYLFELSSLSVSLIDLAWNFFCPGEVWQSTHQGSLHPTPLHTTQNSITVLESTAPKSAMTNKAHFQCFVRLDIFFLSSMSVLKIGGCEAGESCVTLEKGIETQVSSYRDT